MSYISTQKKEALSSQEMSLEEFQKGLAEISPDSSGKISREELFKMLTSTGDRFSPTEANQVLSLIPKEDGWINIEEFSRLLFQVSLCDKPAE